MSKLPRLSGKDIIKILTKEFGFTISRQRGSHVILIRFVGNEKITTVIPLHDEVKLGTLLGTLKLAKVSREEFLERATK